jgi:hypothetical protein
LVPSWPSCCSSPRFSACHRRPSAGRIGSPGHPAIGWVIAFGTVTLVIVVDGVQILASSRRRRRRER